MKVIAFTFALVFFALVGFGYFKAAAIMAACMVGLSAWVLFQLSSQAADEETQQEGDK